MNDLIYLDNAATTKTAKEVYEAMKPYFDEYYGNAASVYRFAGKSTKAVDDARATVADFLELSQRKYISLQVEASLITGH